MKKLLIIFIIFSSLINISYACKIAELGKQIPKDFKQNCYSFIGNITPKITGFNIGNQEKCI